MEEDDKINLFQGSISPLAVSVFSRMKNLIKRINILRLKKERIRNCCNDEDNLEIRKVNEQLTHCFSELQTLSLMAKKTSK
jgi:hypothetical protein